jgi:multidrug efflux pump
LWEGQTGRLFTEFAVAITAAVFFSTVVALTLAPMLCAKLLKPNREDPRLGLLIDAVMTRVETAYEKLLRRAAKMKFFSACCFVAICALTALGWTQLRSEYEPTEDRSVVTLRLRAPEGTGFYTMLADANKITDAAMPLVASGEAVSYMSVVPSFSSADGAANRGFGFCELVPPEQRKLTAAQVMQQLRQKVGHIPGVAAQPFLPAGIGARGAPVQFVIGGPDYDELVQWRDKIIAACRQYPGITDVDYDYKETRPQFHVTIDRERANQLGVPPEEIGSTLETLFGLK